MKYRISGHARNSETTECISWVLFDVDNNSHEATGDNESSSSEDLSSLNGSLDNLHDADISSSGSDVNDNHFQLDEDVNILDKLRSKSSNYFEVMKRQENEGPSSWSNIVKCKRRADVSTTNFVTLTKFSNNNRENRLGQVTSHNIAVVKPLTQRKKSLPKLTVSNILDTTTQGTCQNIQVEEGQLNKEPSKKEPSVNEESVHNFDTDVPVTVKVEDTEVGNVLETMKDIARDFIAICTAAFGSLIYLLILTIRNICITVHK